MGNAQSYSEEERKRLEEKTTETDTKEHVSVDKDDKRQSEVIGMGVEEEPEEVGWFDPDPPSYIEAINRTLYESSRDPGTSPVRQTIWDLAGAGPLTWCRSKRACVQERVSNCKAVCKVGAHPHPHAYMGHSDVMNAIREADDFVRSEQLDGVFECEVIKTHDTHKTHDTSLTALLTAASQSVSPWDTLKSHAEIMKKARSRSPSPPNLNDNQYTTETRLKKVAPNLACKRIYYDIMGEKVSDDDPEEVLDSIWPEHARHGR